MGSNKYVDLVVCEGGYLQEEAEMTEERKKKIAKRAKKTGKEVEDEFSDEKDEESENSLLDKFIQYVSINY